MCPSDADKKDGWIIDHMRTFYPIGIRRALSLTSYILGPLAVLEIPVHYATDTAFEINMRLPA